MIFYNYAKYLVITALLIGLLNCATAPVREVEQFNLEKNYSFKNLQLVDSRAEEEKSLNKIDKYLSAGKPIFLSGSLCPNKTHIHDLGEKMNRIVDSLYPSGFVEADLLNYYVKAIPGVGPDDIKYVAFALGMVGVTFEFWNFYRMFKSLIIEDPLLGLGASFVFQAFPLLAMIPHDWVSALGLLFSGTSVLLFKVSSQKGEAETFIAVKINKDEDIIVSKRTEKFDFGGKIKKYRTESNGETFSAIDLEVIRKMLESAEDDFLNKFGERIRKLNE